MDKIATGSASDRRDLFSESATRLGMSAAVVEKDFWVCWILKRLFADPQLKGADGFQGRNKPVEGIRAGRSLLRGH